MVTNLRAIIVFWKKLLIEKIPMKNSFDFKTQFLQMELRQPQRGLTLKPRVARIRATLGRHDINFTTPTGLHKARGMLAEKIMCNPVGVENLFTYFPRVARIRATPGCDMQPRWG